MIMDTLSTLVGAVIRYLTSAAKMIDISITVWMLLERLLYTNKDIQVYHTRVRFETTSIYIAPGIDLFQLVA